MRINFGRHNGTEIVNLPKNYLAYLYERFKRYAPNKRTLAESEIVKYVDSTVKCFGRCDGHNDECVSDQVCEEHRIQRCGICFGLKLLLLLLVHSVHAQRDTIIVTPIYTVQFSLIRHQPIIVTYTLYHGGGSASRSNDHWIATSITLHDGDYRYAGYDRGHMVPAEDFAYSDRLQALTFSYYNCVPQTAHLNRGQWAAFERKVRILSRTDTVRVVCYNEYGSGWAPVRCYKWVYLRGAVVAKCGYDQQGNEVEVR